MNTTLLLLLPLLAASAGPLLPPGAIQQALPKNLTISISPDARWPERFAAREIRRYVYLRTGLLLPIETIESTRIGTISGIVVAEKHRSFARLLAEEAGRGGEVSGLDEQHYLLFTVRGNPQPLALIAGGGDPGVLYGAYRFAEKLGVRFYLHGDVIPDTHLHSNLPLERRLRAALLGLDERGVPLFDLRGIQPFHDFPEGPDWWNLDDYKAILSQLPKLRMNFFGLHTYPEGGPNAEPTVWIGLLDDAGEDGRVTSSYPASYQNTLRGNWGYAARKTSDFLFGAAALFEHDAYGSDVMIGFCPEPATPEACNEVFHRATALLREAFLHARKLGIKTCVGTETPLTIPKRVQERLAALGKEAKDPRVVEELYRGLFLRAAAAYPLDYYWFWTPEGWTWSGVSDEQVAATIGDIRHAIEAAKAVRAPFTLATCGWVLGPPGDRSLFDKVLPKEMPVSCINRQVGMEPVEPGFALVEGRPKWAIPWLEDDPALTSVQLWAGRMREDAADALRYGCTGLMGIHWRTRILAPNIAALAQAAWDPACLDWAATRSTPTKSEGPEGGLVAAYLESAIADTEDDLLYQTVRYNMSAYHLAVPNGTYTVTLKFCEPHYAEKGKRVFGVKLQGATVIDRLDLFEKVGKDRALDYRFENVQANEGWIDIDFISQVEYPCIAAIAVEGPAGSRKINCGGPATEDYAADWPAARPGPRGLPSADFYLDWARHEFGAAAAEPIAAIFAKVDGKLPRPSDWIGGPGGIRPDPRPWSEVRADWGFVTELLALRSQIEGVGQRDRFDYWAKQLAYMAAMARLNCRWAELNQVLEAAKAASTAEAQRERARDDILPLYRELVSDVKDVYQFLLATVSNTGELGTIANWEQHIVPGLLEATGRELERLLGEALPPDALPSRTYEGPPRVIVPTVRTSLAAGEPLRLEVILLSAQPPRDAALFWTPIGQGSWQKLPLQRVDRSVYNVSLQVPPEGIDTIEYYVRIDTANNETAYFPVTAPERSQTVVVMPAE
ncbi:MAG: malectin domain-containing carbohydrate-binding protein [Planctomycetota bacterium]